MLDDKNTFKYFDSTVIFAIVKSNKKLTKFKISVKNVK